MAETSGIEWTDATWNPWQGCTKLSPACTNCYMFRDLKRYGRDGSVVVRSSNATFRLPLKRKRGGEYAIAPGSKVFTCSWSDWFHASADPWRNKAWDIVRQRPDLTFQIVTKRTDRILDCLPSDWGSGWPNVWIIATVENQEWATKRIPELLRVPAVVRGLSCEPLLGPVDLSPWLFRSGCDPHCGDQCSRDIDCPLEPSRQIDWVIGGGESGPNARPCHPDWARSLRDQCAAAGVPWLWKQWGEWSPECGDRVTGEGAWLPDGRFVDPYELDSPQAPEVDIDSLAWSYRVGKKAAGRTLDGVIHDGFPDRQPV